MKQSFVENSYILQGIFVMFLCSICKTLSPHCEGGRIPSEVQVLMQVLDGWEPIMQFQNTGLEPTIILKSYNIS